MFIIFSWNLYRHPNIIHIVCEDVGFVIWNDTHELGFPQESLNLHWTKRREEAVAFTTRFVELYFWLSILDYVALKFTIYSCINPLFKITLNVILLQLFYYISFPTPCNKIVHRNKSAILSYKKEKKWCQTNFHSIWGI